ncbi:hypothetical protein IGI04_036611 [Brassica rapa subsp. trilocularis]|uniref:Zinc finger GRF-type domain-containing protein n=1 Tax=Brassica rapa subsp. trilocularis TaxID=1813537 RepID=A0ABQ7LEX9_BRACM|nr:hypothetical protein IGI04_036611 [Brassica rapa subsp. trilocularis]
MPRGAEGMATRSRVLSEKKGAGDFLDQLVVGVTRKRSQMDPEAEIRDTKRRNEHIDMLSYVCDSEHGIPTRCPCGGSIIHEVRGKEEYDTLPGKRFFTCINYEADGFHYRQLWVIGVQEHIERLTSRVEEVEAVIKWLPEVNNKIKSLEAEVKALTVEVDRLTGKVYNLTVQVGREEDVRPPGVKASKAAKRKKHGNEAAFDQIETILAAKNMLSKQKILDRSRVQGGGCVDGCRSLFLYVSNQVTGGNVVVGGCSCRLCKMESRESVVFFNFLHSFYVSN